ncbi:SGNH/GDSL hydrolase family protein [Aspergillus aculeatinus CBS 121060]|uniref:Acetylxylan esterase n=1 Tax=Aspergillus aculeatinus CBS 121060 TaxID=1448322 RepID=A0ACD1H3G4_9EURO|nr:acetylxylan esterase [Aspergillus aculeatinus CBS 121060]RAH68065.1 acetylxylan esterase [Aspergillus aculeatinus CBS 121060]
MRFAPILLLLFLRVWPVAATILQNGQPREDPYPGQQSPIKLDDSWRNYDAGVPEIAYKGRWDSQHISWWSAPGIKVEFSGNKLALSFGPSTSNGALVAYRIGSLDWRFSNVTADATYQFIGPDDFTDGVDTKSNVFEMRVTNWGIGVQLAGVSVAKDAYITKPTPYKRKVEIIGGSLAGGQYATYETLSSWSFLYGVGLGDAEFTITAYPGVCLADMQCYGGGVHGMTWWWNRASDPGARAHQFYGDNPPAFDNSAEQPADLVFIQMGGNDWRHPNEVPGDKFYQAYVDMVEEIHRVWPKAEIVLMSQWGPFQKVGTEYKSTIQYKDEIIRVYEYFKDLRWTFVHYLNTDGILQHNDINPKNHPTDVGHIKVASHLLQWTRLVLRWELKPTGEVQHGTLYWNDQEGY